uniref:Putative secreted protein n=1 Tax=Ixodes ricinus TaxID=34613 RepID=A0A147BCP7_IXORI
MPPLARVLSFVRTVVFSVVDEATRGMSVQHREPRAFRVAVWDTLRMCVVVVRGATGINVRWPFLLGGGPLPAATTSVVGRSLVRGAPPCKELARSRMMTTTSCGPASSRWGHPVVVRSNDPVPSAGASRPM